MTKKARRPSEVGLEGGLRAIGRDGVIGNVVAGRARGGIGLESKQSISAR